MEEFQTRWVGTEFKTKQPQKKTPNECKLPHQKPQTQSEYYPMSTFSNGI